MFSIIVPTFNRRNHVSETVRSVLSQDVGDFELIVVDDGSTDGTVEHLERAFGEDTRVRLVSQVNSGRSVARNTGMDASRGGWLVFLDSDDLLEPSALRILSGMITEHPSADIVAGSKGFIGADGEPIPAPWDENDPDRIYGLLDEPYIRLIRQFFFTPGTYCIRREKAPRFKTEFEPCEDYEFLLAAAFGANVVRGSEKVLNYRWYDGNTPQQGFVVSRLKVAALNQAVVESLPPPQRRRAQAEWANRRADDFYEQGSGVKAFMEYLRAVVCNPRKVGEGQIPRQLVASLIPLGVRRALRRSRRV